MERPSNTASHASTTDQLSYVDVKARNLLVADSPTVDSVVVDSPAVVDAAAGKRRGRAAAVLDAGATFRFYSNVLSGVDAAVADLSAAPRRSRRASGTRPPPSGGVRVRPTVTGAERPF